MAGLIPSDEATDMIATVAQAFDQTVSVLRKSTSQDVYGNDNSAYTSIGTAAINVYQPSGTQLQNFAALIGSQKAMMIRFALTTDIREDDHIVYAGLTWHVQSVPATDSYTFSNNALATAISAGVS